MTHIYLLGRGWLLAALLLAVSLTSAAQVPAWQMAMTSGTDDSYTIAGTAADASGNVYVTGSFTGRLQLNSISLSSVGFTDVFVAKWNTASGQFVWVQRAGGLGDDYAADIAVNGSNVYVAGSFISEAPAFGSFVLDGPVQAGGVVDIFVAKLTDAGTTASWTWAQQGNDGGQKTVVGLALSGSSVYLAGTFGGSLRIGGTTLTNRGITDVYVAKLTDAGASASWTWVQQAGGADADQAFDVAANGPNVYVGGSFQTSPAAFGSIAVPSQNPSGEPNGFLAKLTDAGASSTWTWAQHPGGEITRAVAVSGTSVYAAGEFKRLQTFGSIVLPAPAISNVFVTKLTDNGSAAATVWAQAPAGGSYYNQANALCVSGPNVYVAGMFSSASLSFGGTVLRPVGGEDVFVARLTDAGSSASFAWAQSAGSVFNDQARSLALSGTTLLVSGYGHLPLNIGGQVFLGSVSTEVPFFASLSDVPLLPTLAGISPVGGAMGSTVALTGTNLTGATAITFAGTANNVVTTGFTANGPGTRLSGVVVPSGAVTGPVTVTTPAGTSTGVNFSVGTAASAAPPWQAVSPFNEGCRVTGTATDAAGNVYVTGYFVGTVSFGSTSLTSLGNEFDVFVAKWSRASGGFVWAQRAGGPGADAPNAIALNGANVYVTGYFESVTAAFGSTTLTNTGTTGQLGDRDIFITKLTDAGSSGSFTWAQSAGGRYTEVANSLAVNGSSIYVAGDFDGPTVAFGSITVASASAPASGTGYITKLTDAGPSGNFVWAYAVGRNDFASSVAVSGANVYVAGPFLDTATFGSTTLSSLDGNANFDVYVTKLTDAGPTASFTWALRAGGKGLETAKALAVNGANVYVGGSFISSASYFGSTTLLNASNNTDAFVAKISDAGATGQYVWAQRLGGTSADGIGALATSGSNLYMTGFIEQATVDFGSTQLVAGAGAGFLAQLSDGGPSARFSWAKLVGGAGFGGVYALGVNGANVCIGGYFRTPITFDGQTITTPITTQGAAYITSLTDAALPTPVLTGIAPGTGGAGTSLALAGANLSGATTVTFTGTANNTVTTGFAVNVAGTQVAGVVVPSGATTGPVTVTTANGVASGVSFTLAGAPANDDPAGALPLTAVPGPACSLTSGTTADATPSAAAGLSAPAQNRDVFYRFVATETAANVSVQSVLAPTTVALELYGGTAGSLTLLSTTNTGAGSTGSLTMYCTGLTVGHTYYIRLNASTTGGGGRGFAICVVSLSPALTSFSPTIGPIGTLVTVAGTNLSGATAVYFNGVPQTTITNNTGTSLQVAVPSGATTGRLTLVTPTSTLTSLAPYTVPVPGLSVSYGAGNTLLSNGPAYNFGTQVMNTTSATALFLLINSGDGPLTISSVTASGDFAIVGTNAATVAPGGSTFVSATFTPTAAGVRTGTIVITSNAVRFTLNLTGTGRQPAPFITSIAPPSGAVGTLLTITGTNLNGATAVFFNGTVQSSIANNSPTSLQVTVPSGATTGYVEVRTAGGGIGNDVWFTVTAPAASSWQMAMGSSPTAGSTSTVVATAPDASGNVLVAGRFTGTVAFGGATLTSAGSTDLFVAKWSNASQSFVWAQRAGGSGPDEARALAVNGAAVYVTGFFESPTAGFGNSPLTTAGGSDIFVAKLTDLGTSGAFVWAQRAGGGGADQAQALAVNGAAVYVAGRFGSAIASFGATSLSSAGDDDLFVTKLLDAGSTASFSWTQRAGGASSDAAAALAVTGTDVYVAGYFGGTGVFGSHSLTSAGNSDVFVAKLTDAGTGAGFAWAERAGGTGNDAANAVAISGSTVYVAGQFRGTGAAFGSSTLTNADASGLSSDVFVAKLTDAGSSAGFSWAARMGGTADDDASALAVSGSRLYVAGNYQSAAAGFGSITLNNTGTGGSSDLFVAKLLDLGSTGTIAWAQSAGGAGSDAATALGVWGSNVYVGGAVVPVASFGSLILSGSNSTIVGFLASLSDATLGTTASTLRADWLTLYPNPAHGTVSVELSAWPSPLPATLTLLNALGQQVHSQIIPKTAANHPFVMALTNLTPGLYVVNIQAGSTNLVKRLMVK